MRCWAISSKSTHMLNVSRPPSPYCSGAASAHRPEALVFAARRSQSSSGRLGASGSSRCSRGRISSRMKRRLSSGRMRSPGPAFCAGMDLKEMEARGGAADPESDVVEVLQRVERSKHPTIAMVHGDAIAGGCELALHCDLRVMADNARIGMPLARIGLIVPFKLGQKLVEIIGPAHTRHLMFTGRPIDAKRAFEIGMVHPGGPAAEIESATQTLARTLADNAPLSLAGIKAVIQRALELRNELSHDDLDAAARTARASADASEGRRAMLEKRQPDFRGE